MKKLTFIALAISLIGPPAFSQPRDLHNTLAPIIGFAPVVETGDTAHSTPVIDTSLYSSVEFYFITGTLADNNATFAVTVAGGDVVDTTGTTITDSAAITTGFIGTLATASFQYNDDNEIHRLGYVGDKRYIKVTVTPSGNGGNAPIACMAVGRLRIAQ